MMAVIGINISHDASVCRYKNNKIEYYVEDRFKKNKHWKPSVESYDYLILSEKIKITDKDRVVFTSYGRGYHFDDEIIEKIVSKYKIKNWSFNRHNHHLHHALCGFYLSPFKNALCIVMDGGGALWRDEDDPHQEMESVFYLTDKKITPFYKHFSNIRFCNLSEKGTFEGFSERSHKVGVHKKIDGVDHRFSSQHSCGTIYNWTTQKLGFSDAGYSAGKVMGYSAYCNEHHMASQLQVKTELYTKKLIEIALSYKQTKNIVLSGGYAMNCLNNFKYTKHFPKVNIFIDPAPDDAGTAIGAAIWHDYNQDK